MKTNALSSLEITALKLCKDFPRGSAQIDLEKKLKAQSTFANI